MPRGERSFVTCLDCGESKSHEGRGLCSRCHRRRGLAGTLDERPRLRATSSATSYAKPRVICLDCGLWKTHAGRGLCGPCRKRRVFAGTLDERPAFKADSRSPEAAPTTALADPWTTRAACTVGDHALFFPTVGGRATAEAAKGICASCPVHSECLSAALALPVTEDFGIWGGTTERERAELRRRAWQALR